MDHGTAHTLSVVGGHRSHLSFLRCRSWLPARGRDGGTEVGPRPSPVPCRREANHGTRGVHGAILTDRPSGGSRPARGGVARHPGSEHRPVAEAARTVPVPRGDDSPPRAQAETCGPTHHRLPATVHRTTIPPQWPIPAIRTGACTCRCTTGHISGNTVPLLNRGSHGTANREFQVGFALSRNLPRSRSAVPPDAGRLRVGHRP